MLLGKHLDAVAAIKKRLNIVVNIKWQRGLDLLSATQCHIGRC